MVTDALHDGHVILHAWGPTGVPASVEIHFGISMRLNSMFHIWLTHLRLLLGFAFSLLLIPNNFTCTNTPDGTLYC